MTSQHVTKETLRRIISDITEIINSPLHDNGIYYEHDSENILKGYILIIPSTDSPYKYGNYFFSLEFPTNYPYAPPKMKYLTNNGHTRFHPNFYRNGKVCLSLLNTWRGDKWTSCNTLSSILLHVATLFTKDPLLHEPGITESHDSFHYYTDVIEYQNYSTAIYDVLNNKILLAENFSKDMIEHFMKIVKDKYKENKNDILDSLTDKMNKNKFKISVEIQLYKMNEIIDYNEIYLKLKEYNASL